MQESGVVFTCCNIIMYICTCSVVDCCAVANRVLFLFCFVRVLHVNHRCVK